MWNNSKLLSEVPQGLLKAINFKFLELVAWKEEWRKTFRNNFSFQYLFTEVCKIISLNIEVFAVRVVTHCMLVVVYRCFGIACLCHFKCRNAEKRRKRRYTEGGVGGDWFTGSVNEPVRVEHGGKEDKRSGRLQDNAGKMWKGPEKFRRKKDGVGGAYIEQWRKESRLGTLVSCAGAWHKR